MIERIGTVDKIPQFLEDVKSKKELLFGFGHRVYRNTDPRSKIIREVAESVFDAVGREPLIDVAIALRDAALKDQFFVRRKLFPNVDYWSGLIYKAMGFPLDFFPVCGPPPPFQINELTLWVGPLCSPTCCRVVGPLETESG